MVLTGTEVKSLREGKAQLTDGFAQVDKGGVLTRPTSPSTPRGTSSTTNSWRTRKLLLKKIEIMRLQRKVQEKGYTLIPLELSFKKGKAKVRLGLCKGKKQYDKRASIKEKDQRRDEERDGRLRLIAWRPSSPSAFPCSPAAQREQMSSPCSAGWPAVTPRWPKVRSAWPSSATRSPGPRTPAMPWSSGPRRSAPRGAGGRGAAPHRARDRARRRR